MAQIDNNLKKQLAKPQTWFCKYFPKRIRNVGEKEISDRQMVYDFKDGRSFEAVAQMTAASMQEQYGESCKNIVFVQVPASTSPKNELRYKAFCERVCELTGAINGYEHVRVIGGRLAIHENGDVLVTVEGKEQTVDTIPDFPPRPAWDDLCVLAREDDISAEVRGQELAVSWP